MNIANKITLARVFMIPIFLLFMVCQPEWGNIELLKTTVPLYQFISGVIFVVASFTDYLDGYLARKYNLVTAFGEFFDPMADKLLVIAALIILVDMQKVPGWIVFIIIGRELMVTGLRVLLARHDGKVMAAALPGKIKTTTQMLAIIFYLFNDMGFSALNIPIADILLYICLFFTVYSGIDYFYHARFIFEGEM